jgi:periplasmic protein TonB
MTKAIAQFPSENNYYPHSNPLLRALGVSPLAIVVTLALLYAMQQLIHMDAPAVEVKPTEKIPPIHMDIPTDISVRQEEPPIRPVVIELPPQGLVLPPVDVNIDPGISDIGGPMITEKPVIRGISGVGQMIPFIKVPPQYPQTALSRGIEGYVDVMFDVTELGTTDNIRIIAYEPSSVFNNAVLKAIKNWKYKPNVVDGVPVRTPDVRDRVRFNMDKK